MSNPNPDLCPVHTRHGIDRYVQEGTPTGDFLYKVLTNDLFGAVGRADLENLRGLIHVVAYIYHRTPQVCHGSKEQVKWWLALSPEERRKHLGK